MLLFSVFVVTFLANNSNAFGARFAGLLRSEKSLKATGLLAGFVVVPCMACLSACIMSNVVGHDEDVVSKLLGAVSSAAISTACTYSAFNGAQLFLKKRNMKLSKVFEGACLPLTGAVLASSLALGIYEISP